MGLDIFLDCPYREHESVIDVDEHGVAYESCRRDDETFHGDALIYGQVNPSAAQVIRASARWHLDRLAQRFGGRRAVRHA